MLRYVISVEVDQRRRVWFHLGPLFVSSYRTRSPSYDTICDLHPGRTTRMRVGWCVSFILRTFRANGRCAIVTRAQTGHASTVTGGKSTFNTEARIMFITMPFRGDLSTLEFAFNTVSAIPWDPQTALPLKVQCLYHALLDLMQKYRYTARDASAALALRTLEYGDYYAYFRRISIVDKITKEFRDHGVMAILVNTGTMMCVLNELSVQYETLVKSLARDACIHLPMVYDLTFRYRSKSSYQMSGPHVDYSKRVTQCRGCTLTPYNSRFKCPVRSSTWEIDPEYEGKLGMYKHYSNGKKREFGTDGMTLSWTPMEYYFVRRHSSSRKCTFFGPPTRRTQMTCFQFTPFAKRTQILDSEYVVERVNRALSFTTPTKYLAITRELRYTKRSPESIDFAVTCESSPSDPNHVRVSLATSVRLSDVQYGVRVTKIEWVDAEYLRNDKIKYTCFENGVHTDLPYNVIHSYKTWHIVMGNGCRLKVRVDNPLVIWYPGHCGRPESTPSEIRWTVSNTDGNEDFAECSSILQRYYGFQARNGTHNGGIHPMERQGIMAFIKEDKNSTANLDWLKNAKLERPSPTGTPSTQFTDPHTSRLLHAMVLREVVSKYYYRSAEYIRMCSVSG